MKIDVTKIAKLSNLTLTETEKIEFESQLGNIVTYIEKLDKIDTSSVEPTAQVTGLSNVTRNDKFSNDSLSHEEALSGSNKTHNGLFVVDKLVDTT